MSETLDENQQIHYVYGAQEYILDNSDTINSNLGDLTSKAILVDGQLIVTDQQTFLLQDADSNLTQYYINYDNQSFVVDADDTTTSNVFETTECLQLIEDDTDEASQIIYYTNEDSNTECATIEEVDDDEIGQIRDEAGNIYPFKRIKLEGQLLNFDEFIQQQADLEQQNENESVEYGAPEDGATESKAIGQLSESAPPSNLEEESIDLSKITGRNLITGQTVTLHGYMEKLKKRLTKTTWKPSPKKTQNAVITVSKPNELKTNDDKTRTGDFDDLLDKKISIGRTKSGKKIIGKIIHVERKNAKRKATEMDEEEEEEEDGEEIKNEEEIEEASLVIHDVGDLEKSMKGEDVEKEDEDEAQFNEDGMKILVKKCTVSKDSFEEISKTLGGVMEMESVRKKLENKNIVVKLVEKKFVTEKNSFVKNVSYSYGYMDQVSNADGNGEVHEKWKFVPDQETQDVLLGSHLRDEAEDGGETKSTKFPTTTSLTILITYGRGGTRSIRVNLNPAPGNQCTVCAQHFKTNLHLRVHMNAVHNAHEGKLYVCTKCNKSFSTAARLQKHLPTHDVLLKPLECSVCGMRCGNEWGLKKHLLTHTGIRPFACDLCAKQFTTQYDMNFHRKVHFPEKHFACNVCLRTFSRHSNLLRHMEIHKGDGALFKCEICCCSFNYISSLTRHMVQNHIDPGEPNVRSEQL